jgi:hypothetical protein
MRAISRRTWPIGFIVGVAAAGTAAVLLLATSPPGIVQGGPHGASVAREALREMSVSGCFQEAIIDGVAPVDEADAMAEADQFLDMGAYAFVGDVNVLATALGGRLSAQEGNEAWVIVDEPNGPVLAHYASLTTPKGRTLWLLAGKEWAQPDEACKG